ncbi:Nucleoporin nup85 [Rhizophlyctis rosea]|uniref:Nuclear pore complex protein Nup85 n=1 Tax=Rhizophlyctis rosea TaxID=64517 RepID=A0AAD5SHM3_9FUNG|nr:Nucleoporin nup85 [Rhizophlyctis rosea]
MNRNAFSSDADMDDAQPDSVNSFQIWPQGSTGQDEARHTLKATLAPLGTQLLGFPGSVRSDGQPPVSRLQSRPDLAAPIPESRIPFLNATAGVYISLSNENAKDRQSQEPHGSFGKFGEDARMGDAQAPDVSRSAREASGRYQQELQSYSQRADIGQQEKETFGDMAKVWRLCNILHIQNQNDNAVGEELVQWLNDSYPIQPREVSDLTETVLASRQPAFWPLLNKALLRSSTKHAYPLLDKLASDHPAIKDITETIKNLMGERPRFKANDRYHQTWAEWHGKADTYSRERGLQPRVADRALLQPLLEAFGILAGNASVIEGASGQWEEYVVGMILYLHPNFRTSDLPELMEKARGKFGEDTATNRAVAAIFESKFDALMPALTYGEWWLAAHLVDVLNKLRLVDDSVIVGEVPGSRGTESFLESCVFTYAGQLCAHPSLWRIGFEYYLRCPRVGRAALTATIPHIPITSDFQIRKLLAFCNFNNLRDDAFTIHRAVALNRYQNGRVGEAIVHYCLAEEHQKVAAIVEGIMDQFVVQGDLTWRDIASTLSPDVLRSNDRLIFMTHYNRFHSLYEQTDYAGAAKLLVEIFTSHTAPKRYWLTLLYNVSDLLESPQSSIGMEATYELMRCLEEIVTSHRKDDYLGLEAQRFDVKAKDRKGKGKVTGKRKEPERDGGRAGKEQIENVEQEIQVIRLGLVRNLARAMTL